MELQIGQPKEPHTFKRLLALYPDASILTELIFRTGDQRIHCPYGQVGDRLWVRETWATERRLDKYSPSEIGEAGDVALWFRATEIPSVSLERGKWCPSIHMPRWASRITLEITEIRVERLQEIGGGDVDREGVIYDDLWGKFSIPDWDAFAEVQEKVAVRAFAKLWDSLNAKRGYGWETNPWVWVISFELL